MRLIRFGFALLLANALSLTANAEAPAVQPFGLDLCSGVRTEGRLDPLKLQAFFAAISGLSVV